MEANGRSPERNAQGCRGTTRTQNVAAVSSSNLSWLAARRRPGQKWRSCLLSVQRPQSQCSAVLCWLCWLCCHVLTAKESQCKCKARKAAAKQAEAAGYLVIQCSAFPNRYMPLRRALIDLRSGRPRTPDSENWKSNKGKKRRRQLAKKRTASKFCKQFMMVHAPKLALRRDMVAVARSGRRPRKHRRRAAKRNPKPKPKARSKTLLA